jgi:hypothetical protein
MQKATRDILFEFNYSGSQFWFLQWLSLANTVLPTEIIICRFADVIINNTFKKMD